MSTKRMQKIIHYSIRGLPLAGVAVSSLLFSSVQVHQFLVLIALLWFQVFILFEAFSIGK